MFAQSYQSVTIYLQNMKQLLLNATHHCIMNSKHCFGIAVYIKNTQKGKERMAAAAWLNIGKILLGKVWWESTLSVEEKNAWMLYQKCKDKAEALSKPKTK